MKKRTEINIDQLKSQRRLNVQEQLSVKKDSISKEAKHWRQNGIPKVLENVLKPKFDS